MAARIMAQTGVACTTRATSTTAHDTIINNPHSSSDSESKDDQTDEESAAWGRQHYLDMWGPRKIGTTEPSRGGPIADEVPGPAKKTRRRIVPSGSHELSVKVDRGKGRPADDDDTKAEAKQLIENPKARSGTSPTTQTAAVWPASLIRPCQPSPPRGARNLKSRGASNPKHLPLRLSARGRTLINTRPFSPD
jgi:hypothetical protein